MVPAQLPGFAAPFSAGTSARFTGHTLPCTPGQLRPSHVRACAPARTSEAAAAGAASGKSTEGVQAHPGYALLRTPHLRDYLPDLSGEPSPLLETRSQRGFVADDEVVLRSVVVSPRDTKPFQAFTRAGPRRQVFFGRGVRAAIVSCGGICPGINTVIRELTLCLGQYNVEVVFGVQHGYRGFSEPWREITKDDVEDLQKVGGTLLGSSRGGFDVMRIVDAIETRNIDQLYVIGGDGTIMGCQKIFHEVRRRKLKTAVMSVPKTIDNDIPVIDRSFGFETAVDEAQRAINAAYVESVSFPDCVSIVQLMGRNSGFIATHSSMASCEVDICLIPEEPFAIRGPGGVLEHIETVLDAKGHCVVVVAEGCGSEHVGNEDDIGRHLLQEVKLHSAKTGREISTKYLDPTYQLRALPTIASDNIFCTLLAHSAVHGAYAGLTGFTTGAVNGRNAYIPLDLIAGIQNKVDTEDRLWQRLVASTGQPEWVLPKISGDAK